MLFQVNGDNALPLFILKILFIL